MACIFCRIIAGEIPATFVHRDDAVVALRDVNPQAPTHVLIIPVRHIESVTQMGADDGALFGQMFGVATAVAEQEGIKASGFRLVFNHGLDGGQTVGHVHMHLIGGRPLSWPPG